MVGVEELVGAVIGPPKEQIRVEGAKLAEIDVAVMVSIARSPGTWAWRAHSGYATYVFGVISMILSRPDGRRSAMCVLGRMCECMALDWVVTSAWGPAGAMTQ